MELKFGNTKLRAIEKKDCELLKFMMNSAGVEKKILGWNLPVSTERQEKWIEQYENTDSIIRWMIELSNNTTLGMITLREIDWKNREATMEIKTNPYETQRMDGDTKNASYAVIKYAFEELGLHRISSSVLKCNKFSRKLNESLGFQLEGILRGKIFKNNMWNDVYSFGLLLDDYIPYEDGKAPWQIKKQEKAKMIDQDISIYYEGNIYEFDNNIMMDYYPKRIIELVGDQCKTCLELGIGHGKTIEIFSNFFETHVVLEGDKNIIDRFKRIYKETKVEVIETYFEDWETEKLFDVIIMGFILEHVERPSEILKKYARFLSPKGKLYIAVPNAEALNRRVGVEAGLLTDILQLSETDIRFGHKRYYTLNTLRDEILKDGIGLEITKVEGIYLKPITTAQMISLNLSPNIIKGFLNVGKYYPELCLGLLVETQKVYNT